MLRAVAPTPAQDFAGPSLMFLSNRYHDHQLGVFISVDPLVTTTGEPYIYGAANPITYSDPSGLCANEVFEYCLDALQSGDEIQDMGTSRYRSWLAKDGYDPQHVAGFLEQLQTGDRVEVGDVFTAQYGLLGGEAAKAIELFNRYLSWGMIVPDPLAAGAGTKWWSCEGWCSASGMGHPISTHVVGMDSGMWDIAMTMGMLDWPTFQLALAPTPIVKAPVGNGYPAPLGRGSTGTSCRRTWQSRWPISEFWLIPAARS